MKKYWISKFYVHTFIGTIGFLILYTVLSGVVLPPLDPSCTWEPYFLVSVGVLGIILIVYFLLFDFAGGKFAIDADGIRVYVGLKCYTHPWESLTHCGIEVANVGGGTNTVYTYWIYFANRRLTVKERTVFLRKTRRDLVNIAFFQYEHEPFELALQFAPEHLRTQLEALPRPEKRKRSPVGWRR